MPPSAPRSNWPAPRLTPRSWPPLQSGAQARRSSRRARRAPRESPRRRARLLARALSAPAARLRPAGRLAAPAALDPAPARILFTVHGDRFPYLVGKEKACSRFHVGNRLLARHKWKRRWGLGLISLNGYLAEYLKSCAKRLYREYGRDEEVDLPEGWHWTTIGEISEMVCRGITPKYNDESDELILGQTYIRNNLVLLENGRLHAPRKITEKWLKKYDLLINSTGVGSLGRTAQVWFDPSKLVVDSHVTTVRAADPRHALYMGFWAFEHERYIESLHTGSTGQTELPRDHVKAIRLVLPSDAELEKFNAVAQPAVELIVANQKESKRLAELRDTLLPKLMSGEMDVSSVAI